MNRDKALDYLRIFVWVMLALIVLYPLLSSNSVINYLEKRVKEKEKTHR